MSVERQAIWGAGAGIVGVLLFVTSAVVFGDQPSLDAGGDEVARYLDDRQTAIQVGCALGAAAAPFFVWFMATIASMARAAVPEADRAGTIALGCGLLFFALYLADVGALAVGALRPANMAAEPQLAASLYDLSWMLPAMVAPLGSAVLAAFAFVALRTHTIWPPWLGWVAIAGAGAYSLRLGALFTTEGVFAADGLLGLYVPVVAFVGWILLASVVLLLRAGDRAHS